MSRAARWIYPVVIALLLLVIAVMIELFVVKGSTRPGSDGRTVVLLDPGERDRMLHEMRGFVAGLQAISAGLAQDDRMAVAKASRAMGMAAAHDVPPGMLGKLPLAFKRLAFGVHGGFDQLADAATAGAAPADLQRRLAGILGQCVACHETYQVSPAAPQP